MFLGGILINLITVKHKGGCEVFFKFGLKNTSCACLLMSLWKVIFHCNAQSWTLARSSFNSFVEASTLKTKENS